LHLIVKSLEIIRKKNAYKTKVLILFFVVSSCATGVELIEKGNIKVGMSKQQLRDVLFYAYTGDDPFLGASHSEIFYQYKKEIIYGSSKNIFYVFRNVTSQMKCGTWACDYGNGYLENWFYSLNNARNYIQKKESFKPKIEVVKESKKTSTQDDDTMDQLNKIVEDYKSGKITEEEFNKKKKEILD